MAFRESTIADRKHTLDTDKALEVLQDLGEMDCKTVNFSGGGEPLLHPDFGTILKFAVRQGLRTWIVTNGFFIDKWLPELKFAHHVRVSLDASNAGEHAVMHGKAGEFMKICLNIEKMCASRDTDPLTSRRMEAGISYLVADCNSSLGSIREIFTFAKDVGVNFIHFRPLSEDTPKMFTGDWPAIAAMIEEVAMDYPAVECFPVGKRHRDVFRQREFQKCYASMVAAVIGADGSVVACCDERTKVFGSVYEQSFKSIWYGARHIRKAREIVPALCTRCLMCSVNKAVEDFIVGDKSLPELI